jgi:hypothetical protein
MAGTVLFFITIDHDLVRSWAEVRDARPSKFEGMTKPSPLRFDLGPPDAGLTEMSWTEFFEEFERDNLAFYYRDMAPTGEHDDLHGFVSRAAVPDLTMASKSTIIERAI